MELFKEKDYQKSLDVDGEFSKLLQRVDYITRNGDVRAVSVFSELEEEGKTHLILLLSYHLSKIYSRKILIVDTDFENDALLEKLKNNSCTSKKDYPYIQEIEVDKEKTQIDLLTISAFEKSTNAVDKSVVFEKLEEVVQLLKKEYSLIFVDTKSADLVESFSSFVYGMDAAIMLKSQKSLELQNHKVSKRLKNKQMDIIGIIYNNKKS